jgi:S-DNA-T family DNA segregation ATPase FtsK/SpoIIIE
VVLTAERPAALPMRLGSAIPRRLIMRLADDNDYAIAGVNRGVLTAESPPGRAVMSRSELHIAVLGGSPDITAQSQAIARLAATMRRQQVAATPPVGQLPALIRLLDLPAAAGARPVIGVDDDSLGAVGFRPEGAFLVSGPPESGRTTAVATLVTALARTSPGPAAVFFGSKRSPLVSLGTWHQVIVDPDEIAEAAAKLDDAVRGGQASRPLAVVIEGLADFLGGPADLPLTSLITTLSSHGHLVIAEAETSVLSQSWPLLNAVKSKRTGLALQPEQTDGLVVYKTEFPKSRRSEFPRGRGFLVEGGRVTLMQIAIPE